MLPELSPVCLFPQPVYSRGTGECAFHCRDELKFEGWSEKENVHTGLIRPGSQDPVNKEKLRIRKSPE